MTSRSDSTASARHRLAVVVQFHLALGLQAPALALVHTIALAIQFVAPFVADAHGAAVRGKARLEALAAFALVRHKLACLHARRHGGAGSAARHHGHTGQGKKGKHRFHDHSRGLKGNPGTIASVCDGIVNCS